MLSKSLLHYKNDTNYMPLINNTTLMNRVLEDTVFHFPTENKSGLSLIKLTFSEQKVVTTC